jgi:hypothetical protein
MVLSPSWRTLICGGEASLLPLPASCIAGKAGGSRVIGFPFGVAVLRFELAVGVAGGATAFTPGSFIPGGGGTLDEKDCAETFDANRLEASRTLAATSKAAVFMAATSIGVQSITVPSHSFREAD